MCSPVGGAAMLGAPFPRAEVEEAELEVKLVDVAPPGPASVATSAS